jgi:hypothetical protein
VDGGEARWRVRGLDQCPGRNLEVKALQRHFAERVQCARARLWVRAGDFGRKCEDLSFLGSSRFLHLNQQDLALSYIHIVLAFVFCTAPSTTPVVENQW